MVDAIVIGGGFGGLAAAIRLGSAGRRVTLLEASSELGGKAGTVMVDGVRFDTGPSVLTLPAGIVDLFESAGEVWTERLSLRKLERAFRYEWPDGSALEVAATFEGTLANVEATFGSAARDELARFLDHARHLWEVVAPTFVYGQAPTWSGVLQRGPRLWWQALHIDAFRTMQRAVDDRIREPHLRDVLLRYATYNGSDPRQAPATLHCIAFVELGLGGFGVEGGMGALVSALVGLAERRGVTIRTGCPVAQVITAGGRVTGVVLADGRVIETRVVVANTEARALVETLMSGRARPEPPRTRSSSGWTAVARARRRPDRAAHTVLFPARYEREFEDLFDARTMPSDPTIYCCAQEQAHGLRGWAEEEPLFVMVNAPAAFETPPDFSERIRAALVARGVLDPADRFVWERSPADLARRFPGSDGSLYGRASHGWNAAFLRPPNEVAGTRGLYLASGSAHPGGGVPLAIQSGCEAARLALRTLE